ncbi:hypothetical protein HMI54_013614 [Coelomomyces lativittatus]|nr:hypothetical protein HMI54_013614 [Coelomomyces lativittatus]
MVQTHSTSNASSTVHSPPPGHSSPNILIEQFQDTYLETVIYFTIMKFSNSMYIWIGEQVAIMTNLAMGLHRMDSTPLSTKLFGSLQHDFSTLIASRLGK